MLCIKPLELKEANLLIDLWHRHHKPVVGHRFSIGAYDTKQRWFVGAAVVGRPVARLTNYKEVLEVTRLATDGTKNACSFLYSAAARIGREMGYIKIQTFILDTEPGTSLIASGWLLEDASCGGGMGWHSRDGRRKDQPYNVKQRWFKELNKPIEIDPDYFIMVEKRIKAAQMQPRLL